VKNYFVRDDTHHHHRHDEDKTVREKGLESSTACLEVMLGCPAVCQLCPFLLT